MELSTLEIIGALIGLLYLWLELRASIYLWPVSIIMPLVYIFIYYQAGLYADFGISIYYTLAAIYGWCCWKRKRSEAEIPITRIPLRLLPVLSLVFMALLMGISYILIHFTDSTVPWTDSFTTALSILAMWMLARKYLEQWWAWALVDLVSCGLYIYKGLYFTSLLYGLYTLIAVWGYYRWKRMMNYNLETT